jgi:small subunit ribosomal protein S4
MARYIDAKCKLCRREGVKLFLKGERCFSEKCAMNRKPYPPGQKAVFSVRRSTYGTQLREKQRVKRIYGISETQLKNLLDKAGSYGGNRGLRLLQLLEMRLDNVVYLLGLFPSRAAARQAVSHGKVTVNSKKMTIPSYTVLPGDILEIKDKSMQPVSVSGLRTPTWLKKQPRGGTVTAEPTREMIDDSIKENLIIEFYSR